MLENKVSVTPIENTEYSVVVFLLYIRKAIVE
jgi:hypothetical protein